MRLIAAMIIVQLALGSLAFAVESPEERAEALSSFAEFTVPQTGGPHPLAILMPGCLGWHPHHERWRDDLLSRGFAVLQVDSFGARGVDDRAVMERDICTGRRIPGSERAGDLMAVLRRSGSASTCGRTGRS